jgi:Tfp pilus assembly protein PilV
MIKGLVQTEGYSLIEVILVVLIIAIAIPPILQLFSDNLTNSMDSEIYTKACYLAEEKMEEIFADKRASGRGYDYIVEVGQYLSVTPVTGFTCSVSIDETKSYAGIDFAEIVVTVSHQSIEDVILYSWVTDYD